MYLEFNGKGHENLEFRYLKPGLVMLELHQC